jgi:hypothetical protein
MTRIMHRAGIGVAHGAGDGLSEFPSDLADAGTAGSAAAFSVQTSDASALVTPASSIRGSDAPALYMRVLVAVSVTAWAGASTAAAGTARPAHVRHRRLGRGDWPSPGPLPEWPFWPLSLIGTGTCDAHLCVFALVFRCGMRPDLAVPADFRVTWV